MIETKLIAGQIRACILRQHTELLRAVTERIKPNDSDRNEITSAASTSSNTN